MTFVSELVEPWEPNRVAVMFSLVLGGHLWWLPLGLGYFRRQMQQGPVSGRRLGLPPFLILPSTCGLLFPGASLGRVGQLAWTVDAAGLWGPKRKTQKMDECFYLPTSICFLSGPAEPVDFYWNAISSAQQLLSQWLKWATEPPIFSYADSLLNTSS